MKPFDHGDFSSENLRRVQVLQEMQLQKTLSMKTLAEYLRNHRDFQMPQGTKLDTDTLNEWIELSERMILLEDAERAAIAWSQEADADTMHLRSLRNKLRKAAGLDPIPDTEPVEPLAP